MPSRTALLIAIEQYATIPGVRYATDDAKELAQALRDVGYDIPSSSILLNGDATKATIESRLRTALGNLRKDDTFVLFYAGHGFAKADENYLTCYDTQRGDLQRTCIPLQEVYRSLRASKASQILVFLDSCYSGLEIGSDARSIVDQMSHDELLQFFEEAETCLCFSSCKVDEEALSHPAVKHGVWTYHLLEALRGNVPEVVDSHGFLTAHALQDHLSVEVPRTIRKLFRTQRLQTPWLFGGTSRDALVADLSELLARRRDVSARFFPASAEVRLRGSERIEVRKLGGFSRSSHHVPYEINDWTRAFVVRCAQPNLRDLQDEFFSDIRNAFGYKRRDLEATEGDGDFSIIAPRFRLSISCEQSSEYPSQAEIITEVSELGDLSIIEDPAFDEVFGKGLSHMVILTDQSINIESAIDALEDLEQNKIALEYPSDCSACKIQFVETKHILHIAEHEIYFERRYPSSPANLLADFKESVKMLSGPRGQSALFASGTDQRVQAIPGNIPDQDET